MIVLDASAVVDALVDEPPAPQLIAHLAGSELHAPELLDYEVASALWGHVLAGRLGVEQLQEVVGLFGDLRIERWPLSSMMSAVLALRDNFTTYDAAYVVLADVLDVPLVTGDEKMTQARRLGVDVQVSRKVE